MKLTRPIVFMDLETTGLSIAEDRIIEMCMIKISESNKDGVSYYRRINPQGKQISSEAFSKHGIKNEDLIMCPTFEDLSEEIFDFIKDCDLGGYNCKKFDIPLLIEEFLRCKISINVKNFNIVDVFKILNVAEPRSLEATYKRFLGKELSGAHNAEYDIIATIEILEQLEKHFELPESAKELDNYAFEKDNSVDLENKLKWKEDKIIFNFGKYKDKTIQEVYKIDASYFDWIISSSDMTRYTKSIFYNIKTNLNKGLL